MIYGSQRQGSADEKTIIEGLQEQLRRDDNRSKYSMQGTNHYQPYCSRYRPYSTAFGQSLSKLQTSYSDSCMLGIIPSCIQAGSPADSAQLHEYNYHRRFR